MLNRLLESRGRPKRSVWGAALSTVIHTAVIAIAVFATAQARVEAAKPLEGIKWIYPPAPPAPTSSSAPAPATKRIPVPRVLDIPDRIDVPTAPLDVAIEVPAPGPVSPGDATGAGPADRSVGSGASTDLAEAFSADRVERQAYLESGSLPPRYPHSLRAAGVEGEVTALFIVSETGRVERGSLRFTRSDNPLFEAAVKEALERMRFIPAEVAGRKVRQLVQMPFVFRLGPPRFH